MARILKERTRNHGTMTESAFWSFIRSALRKQSMYWKPIQQARIKARRPYTGANKRQKWEYQCDICKKWFIGIQTHVDHIEPIGEINLGENVKQVIENMFCEVDNLRVLCVKCHKQHTKNQKQKNAE